MGLKIVHLSSSKFISDGLRVVSSCLVLSQSTTVSFLTVVQDQCTYCTLYYCITSLPVYLNTVHGRCTTVVLDTSNRVYCLLLLMVARYSVVQIVTPAPHLKQFEEGMDILVNSSKNN